MLSLKLGVVGSRRRNSIKDKKLLKEFIYKAKQLFGNLELISGGCPKGADRFADEIAYELNIPIINHYPDKSKLSSNPKRYEFTKIYYDRNILIAKDCDCLVALVAYDRKGGTEHTIKETIKLGKKVIIL